MDTQSIRAQMPTLVSGHVPRNIRRFKFNIFDGQPKVSTACAPIRRRKEPSTPGTVVLMS